MEPAYLLKTRPPPKPSQQINSEIPARKKGFVTATKLGTTDKIFVAATKNFATATKSFVDRTFCCCNKIVFAIPILTNDFVSITKPFFPCGGKGREDVVSKVERH